MEIRDATREDVAAIARIYNQGIAGRWVDVIVMEKILR